MESPQPLILIAAGGLAREVMAAVDAGPVQEVVGLLDDDAALVGTTVGGAPVLGGVDAAGQFPEVRFVVCAGSGQSRRQIVRRLADAGIGPDRYATVIHRRSEVPANCSVGVGSVVLANVTLTADVVVGNHVILMPQVVLTHDDRVGDFATLCAGVAVGGGVEVGSGAYLGMNASILQNLQVGAGATLGMGSVLLRDLPDNEVWAGIPAVELPGSVARAPGTGADPDIPAGRAAERMMMRTAAR